jgi:hypothetical protein
MSQTNASQRPGAEDCERRWEEYRSLRRWYVVAAVALEPYGDAAFFGVAIIGGVMYYVFGTKLGRWRCPRCGQPFAAPNVLGRHIPLVRRCVSCGLEAGQCP